MSFPLNNECEVSTHFVVRSNGRKTMKKNYILDDIKPLLIKSKPVKAWYGSLLNVVLLFLIKKLFLCIELPNAVFMFFIRKNSFKKKMFLNQK